MKSRILESLMAPRRLQTVALPIGLAIGTLAWSSCSLFGIYTPVPASDELSQQYEQFRPTLTAGYLESGAPLIQDFISWRPAATGPAKTGSHGGRLLMTYVNDAGYDTYVAYAPEAVMPLGTKIAKESFSASGDSFKPGPIFFMEKVGLEEAPDTDGWFYSKYGTEGGLDKISQSFCHNCHAPYKDSDFVGYPGESARIGFVAPVIVPGVVAQVEAMPPGDAEEGEFEFESCSGCHKVGPSATNGVGPHLNGIVGRGAGSVTGYEYSESLAKAGQGGLVWDDASLFAWLANPTAFLQSHLADPEASSMMGRRF